MSCALEQIPLSRSRGLEMGFTGRLNTAFIERAPLTVRNARGSTGSAHLGYGEARPTPARQSRVVARVLSLCASSPSTTRGVRVATRARGQTGGATLLATYGSSGSWQNHPSMDST